MGGAERLASLTSSRAEYMTMWQRTTWDSRPAADAPSFERHVDLRDYTTRRWRNTRYFVPGTMSIADVVNDTIGARTQPARTGGTETVPLNVTYVDERRELFAFAPERTLLLARAARDLRALPDTSIDGQRHRRVRATVEGFVATYYLREADKLPARVHYRADATNDFGLAQWEVHDIDVWYGNWMRVAPGVLVPRQRDVYRVGRPYKRMTALTLAFNVPAPADSFAIADEVAQRFLATEQRPMWKISLDSAQIVAEHFASFPRFIGSVGALRVGGQWVLIETAQHRGAVDLVDQWLRARGESGVQAGIVARPFSGNGGARWFTAGKGRVFAAPGAAPALRAMGAGQPATTTYVPAARWVRLGSDSLYMEPVDFADGNGAMVLYSPTHRWFYSPFFGVPQHQAQHDALLARYRARGWPIEWVGSVVGLRAPAPAVSK